MQKTLNCVSLQGLKEGENWRCMIFSFSVGPREGRDFDIMLCRLWRARKEASKTEKLDHESVNFSSACLPKSVSRWKSSTLRTISLCRRCILYKTYQNPIVAGMFLISSHNKLTLLFLKLSNTL